MCIVITGNNLPSNTKIIQVPVTIDMIPHNCLIYTNNLVLDKATLQNDYFTVGKYLESSFNNNTKDPSMLIVPIPIPKRSKLEFGFFDVTNKKIQKIIFDINTLKDSKDKDNINFDTIVSGNYKISVTRSKEELLNRIDWNVFTKPYDFESRVKTLDDRNLFYPEYDWVYIVLIAEQNISNNGFGIVYKSLDIDFFPIASMNKDNFVIEKNTIYNHELYHFSNNTGIDSKIGPLKSDSYTTKLNNVHINLLNVLSTVPIEFERGIIKRMTVDIVKFCNYYKVKGGGKNKNVYLLKQN
jgi:hypothetical protein